MLPCQMDSRIHLRLILIKEHFVETRQSHPFKMFTGEEYGEGWTGLNILSNCTIGKNSK